VASFPWSDYWMPLPVAGSRPAVLGRRWTPAASTTSAPPRDYWTLTQPDDSAVPVLERHSAGGGPLPVQTSVRAVSHGGETVTATAKTAAPLADRMRHSAGGGPVPTQTASVRAVTHAGETVTATAKTAPPLADRQTLSDRTPTAILPTVTPTPLDSPPQTVTRLCVGCGKPLEGKRPQAKAHGVACRQRAYRRRKKEARQAQGRRDNGRGSESELASLAQRLAS
jgi:hypothetical protein